LRVFTHEIRRGDVVYVKEGKCIVGKGVVSGPYRFDKNKLVIDRDGDAWRHQRPVKWLAFEPVEIQVGDQQRYTIRPLNESDCERIERKSRIAASKLELLEAIEGERFQRQLRFRKRNRALIAAKKAGSDGRCEVCRFSFPEAYGSIGNGYIIAHHDEPIGVRSRPSRTSLADISLVCPNCHAMLHTDEPPLTVGRLRSIVGRQQSRKRRPAAPNHAK
jgi:predicted HNH restriction endonuclease